MHGTLLGIKFATLLPQSISLAMSVLRRAIAFPNLSVKLRETHRAVSLPYPFRITTAHQQQ